MGRNIINGILGIAVLVAAFMGLTGGALTWTLAILGILIAIIGFSGGSMQSSTYREQQRSMR